MFSSFLSDSKLCQMNASSSLKAVWDKLDCGVSLGVHPTDLSGSLCSSDHLFQHVNVSISLVRPESVSFRNSRQQPGLINMGKPSKLQSFNS